MISFDDGIGSVDSTRSQIEIILYLFAQWTQLPELYSFFQHDEEFLRFMKEFGGTTIHVPSQERLGRMFRNVRIWNVLNKLAPAEEGKHFTRAVKDLAEAMELTENRVRAIYREVDAVIKEQSGGLRAFLDRLKK